MEPPGKRVLDASDAAAAAPTDPKLLVAFINELGYYIEVQYARCKKTP
jgi:hypothetical protein